MKTIKLLPLSIAIISAAASGLVIADDDFSFTGYGRYGMAYEGGDTTYVSPDGAYNGSSSLGRLGNEAYGGEIQFNKFFTNDAGAEWQLAVMAEDWVDDNSFHIKKFYASGTNIFENQPNMTVWGGRNFNQRPQQGLNDYAWMTHDGQGAGFQNMQLGDLTLDMAVVGQADGRGDNGYYAVTTKLAGIGAGPAMVDLYANYGFQNDEVVTDTFNAFQIGSQVKMDIGTFTLRYSSNSDNTVLYSWSDGLKEDTSNIYVSYEGGQAVNESFSVDYLLAYHNRNDDNDDSNTRANYSGIVRPMFQWDDVNSTWLEAGYTMIDYYDADATNSAWKFTASQNIAINSGAGARPMLRFYATIGSEENETSTDEDIMTLGAMFEAWW